MKLSKILSISAILLAGLMLTGCQKEPGSGGTSGIKAEDVIKVSNDGKTVKINYTNNTDEEQKFGPIFFDENFGSKVTGQFKLYDLDKGTPYEFGMIVDDIDCGSNEHRFNVIKLNLLGIKNVNGTDYNQFNYYLSIEDTSKDNLFNLNFSEVDNDEHRLSSIYNLEIKSGNEYNNRLNFEINYYNNDSIAITGYGIDTFPLLRLLEGKRQLGYFLIIQPNSICHLELELN